MHQSELEAGTRRRLPNRNKSLAPSSLQRMRLTCNEPKEDDYAYESPEHPKSPSILPMSRRMLKKAERRCSP